MEFTGCFFSSSLLCLRMKESLFRMIQQPASKFYLSLSFAHLSFLRVAFVMSFLPRLVSLVVFVFKKNLLTSLSCL